MKKKKISTRLVRGGVHRSPFFETSETLYLTSGYVYKTAEEAEDAFNEKKKRFMYSRFGNPTIEMFQNKMSQIEEAETCWATATGDVSSFYYFYVIFKKKGIESYPVMHCLEVVIL